MCLLPPNTMSGIRYALNKCLRKRRKERRNNSLQASTQRRRNTCKYVWNGMEGNFRASHLLWPLLMARREAGVGLSNVFTAVSLDSDCCLSHTHVEWCRKSGVWLEQVLWRIHLIEYGAKDLRNMQSLWYAQRPLPGIILEQWLPGKL